MVHVIDNRLGRGKRLINPLLGGFTYGGGRDNTYIL
jgi:hypothetical protein